MARLLVVGLDGGTDSVIGLPDAGLPNVAEVREQGASGTLISTVRPITAAAWPSMMTGWKPRLARHVRLPHARDRALQPAVERRHSSSFEEGRDFVTSQRWSGAAFWGQADALVAILSVPMTFPAWEVDGRMVAGFPLPDYDRNHTQPPGLADELPPLLDFADRIGKLSDRELADRCLALIEQQRKIVMRWLREGRQEVMVVVLQSIDFAQHRLWKYLDRPGHPLREALLEMYRGIDAMWARPVR
jgi:predicted AlkP superfamily phosphohydrolase/phosphomutase